MKTANSFFFLLIVLAVSSFLYVQNAYAVTVYPGTVIQNTGVNPFTKYTADAHPNFNVTSITVTNNHITFGTKFYDLTSASNTANANITSFNEDINFTLHQTGTLHSNTILTIHGLLQQVKLGNFFYPYGIHWRYINSNTDTQIDVGTNANVFGSWVTGPILVNHLTLSGSIFGATVYFKQPIIFVTNPVSTTVSEIGLFNTDGLLYDHIFSPPISVIAGQNVTIPYKFNDTRTGVQTYTAEAIVQAGSNYTIAESNSVTLYFGSFTPGQLTLNYTNTVKVPFTFTRTDINSTLTNLDVFYPSSFNSTCKLTFNIGLSNHTYHNLPTSHATFQFTGNNNEVVDVNCLNENGNETGTYVLTQSQSDFPLLQQIKDFRSGKTGTLGMFGAFDMVTLLGLILSIIGFNRVNESVGAVFNTALIGVFAYFGIIQWPVILSAGVALVLVLVISSTRKTQGY